VIFVPSPKSGDCTDRSALPPGLVLTHGCQSYTNRSFGVRSKRSRPRAAATAGAVTQEVVAPVRVLAYVRVSSEEQSDSRAGLEAQRTAIEAECARRGWKVVEVVEDAGYSAKDLKRPGVRAALEELERGRADGLVVAKLDRLSRSMLDFTAVMAKAQKEGWALVALDCAVDTTTPAGEAMAHVLATFAQFERRLIGQRTKEALAMKKRQGVRLGRPATISPKLARRIRAMRRRGLTLQAICDRLNEESVPTPRGGALWRPTSLRAVLGRR
jgi:DNA invertase Pin-like site-specific DNA recombinase